MAAADLALPHDRFDDEEYDPFDFFDKAMGADTCRTPYPEYAEQRPQCPVQKVDLAAVAGDAGAASAAALGLQDIEVFQALDHASVSAVLRDHETFSSAGYAASMGVVMGPTILAMDPPEHTRYRGLIQQAFTKRSLDHWEDDLVGPVVNGLVDEFVKRGSADLVRELTFPFPVNVIAGLLGLPAAHLFRFHRWTVELISVSLDPERGMAASQKLAAYLTPFIEERREKPGDDLISALAQAELDGERLDTEHILGFLRLLLPAGAETTYRSSSNLLYGLLTNPDQLAAVRDDRRLLPQAIEEGLRWEAPLTGIARICTRDTELEGVKIPAGAMVGVVLGAANHDETRWDHAEDFDLHRKPQQHMAFAYGAHRCLGMHLARMETTVAINAVLDRLPNLRLDPAAEDVHVRGRGFRSPRHLPVLFDSE